MGTAGSNWERKLECPDRVADNSMAENIFPLVEGSTICFFYKLDKKQCNLRRLVIVTSKIHGTFDKFWNNFHCTIVAGCYDPRSDSVAHVVLFSVVSVCGCVSTRSLFNRLKYHH